MAAMRSWPKFEPRYRLEILARLVGQRVFGVQPEPSLLVLVAVLLLAAGVTLLGSALPLRRASRYEPAPILRGE